MRQRLSLLALAPLLAGSSCLVSGIVSGLLGLLLLTLCGLLLAPLRGRLSPHATDFAALLIGAWLASCAGLLVAVISTELAEALGPTLPLLALACLGLSASQSTGVASGLRLGLPFLAFSVLLGGLREAVGQGSLLANLHWLPGLNAPGWQFASGLSLLTQVAGTLILLGLLLSLYRHFFPDAPQR